ncbi:phosphatidylinositol-specific phospholipase C [Enterococcus plantarum]|uniref:phosphatidylinositol-specific phospholipase C n=1 Tax=Enterococcus plantarum TaxID=1077675 RepID=UPI001A8F9B7B|nr:phosphatidylinositol-specific phospholipase C [Enterococcus plantarum]MBO0423173.1 phosphatidylinositol-specific phospholipase C [Enterococcus plantarum]
MTELKKKEYYFGGISVKKLGIVLFSLLLILLFKVNDSEAASLGNHSQWMNAIRDDTEISRLSIPGSHDSGTFKLRDPIKQVWGMTQDRDFEDQFSYGVRFFDIRVRAVKNDQLVLHHGSIFLYASLWEFINSANTFLKNNPSETIIMSLKTEYEAMPGVTKSVEEIFRDTYYDNNFYKGNSLYPKLEDVRGKIVLMNRMSGRIDFSGIPYIRWDDNKTFSKWIGSRAINVQDQYNVSYYPKKEAIEEFLRYTNNNADDGSYFINFVSLSSGGTMWSSPYYYAGYLNPSTAQYINSNSSQRAGWVIMDYAGKEWGPRLYESVIKTNSRFTK